MSNLNDFNREAKAALWVVLQWLLLAVPTGLVCGAVGTAFHLSVEYVTELRAAQSWLLLCLPLAGLAIVALYKVTKCEGVGTNNVIRAVQSGEPVSLLLVPAIFLGTVLTHLCGGSAGREGAALQMGGSIGWNVGKLLHLSDYVRRTATISGMAAFFSALFGTPLTAALFAMMVEDVGLTFTSAFMPAFTSALIAYGVSLFFGIAPTNFVLNSIPHLTLETALQTALLGIACAAVTRLFCWTLHTLEHGIPKRIPNPWLRAFAGGAAVAAFSYLFGVGRYNGAGMAVIADAVEQGSRAALGFSVQDLPDRPDPGSRLQRRRGGPKFLHRGDLWLHRRAMAGPARRVCRCHRSGLRVLRSHKRPDPLHPAGIRAVWRAGAGAYCAGLRRVLHALGPPRPLQQPDLCHQQAAAGVRLPQVAGQAEEKRRMIFRRFSPRRA